MHALTSFNLKHLESLKFSAPRTPVGVIAITFVATFIFQHVYNCIASKKNKIEPGRVVYNSIAASILVGVPLVAFGSGFREGMKAAGRKMKQITEASDTLAPHVKRGWRHMHTHGRRLINS